MDSIAAYLAAGGCMLEKGGLGHLAHRASKPERFFARGELAFDGAPMVAVVGTREPTPDGLTLAGTIAASLAKGGAVVVSGGANGIDRAAHEAAIAAGGRTIAVLGTGAAKDERPGWMRPLFDRDRGRALSITPYPPGTPHADWHYAARNKFIAGLADAVVIVEGRRQSGTRHTADAARKFGVPLWCCLGNSEASAIGYDLVDEGRARALRPWLDAAAVVLGVPAQPALAVPQKRIAPPDPLLEAVAARGGQLHLDEAGRRLAMPLGRVLARAAELEAEGWLRRDGAFLVTT